MNWVSNRTIPPEWDITYSMSTDGTPHRAAITRTGLEMHRLEVPGTAMSERAARIELHAQGEAWIWGYLLQTGEL